MSETPEVIVNPEDFTEINYCVFDVGAYNIVAMLEEESDEYFVIHFPVALTNTANGIFAAPYSIYSEGATYLAKNIVRSFSFANKFIIAKYIDWTSSIKSDDSFLEEASSDMDEESLDEAENSLLESLKDAISSSEKKTIH